MLVTTTKRRKLLYFGHVIRAQYLEVRTHIFKRVESTATDPEDDRKQGGMMKSRTGYEDSCQTVSGSRSSVIR